MKHIKLFEDFVTEGIFLNYTQIVGNHDFKKFVEAYEELDPIIVSYGISEDSAKYVFQGYQIYQVVDASVDPSELSDVDRARLIAQCDIKDGVTQLINYPFDDNLGAGIPTEMVNGTDEGIVLYMDGEVLPSSGRGDDGSYVAMQRAGDPSCGWVPQNCARAFRRWSADQDDEAGNGYLLRI